MRWLIKMKIAKEKIMKVVNNPKCICWGDMLKGLNLLPLFDKYKKEHNKQYDIRQIKMGKTLLNEIEIILKKNIRKTKDRRVSAFIPEYRVNNILAMDALLCQPEEAKEDIDYMLLEEL